MLPAQKEDDPFPVAFLPSVPDKAHLHIDAHLRLPPSTESPANSVLRDIPLFQNIAAPFPAFPVRDRKHIPADAWFRYKLQCPSG